MGLLCVGFVILILIYSIAIFAVPHTFDELIGMDRCPDPKTYKGLCHEIHFEDTHQWLAYIGRLDKKNQFLIIGVEIMRKSANLELDLDLDYKIEISPVDEYGKDHEETEDFLETRSNRIKVRCDEDDIYCEENILMLYPQIEHQIYKILVEIDVPESLDDALVGAYFSARIISKKYTNFLMSLRYTFFAFSCVFGFFYLFFFFRSPREYKTFEHKFIAILSIALIFFNDPFYAATIYKANGFLAFFSTFWVVLFFSLLIFFWIVMIQRIHNEPFRHSTKFVNRYSITIGLIGFLLLIITGTIAALAYRFDPEFHINEKYPKSYMVFRIFLTIYALTLLILLFMNIYKLFQKWKKVIPRHRLFFILSVYFFFAVFLFLVLGVYQSYDSDGVKVFLLIFLFNFYIYLLQIFWRFTNQNQNEF